MTNPCNPKLFILMTYKIQREEYNKVFAIHNKYTLTKINTYYFCLYLLMISCKTEAPVKQERINKEKASKIDNQKIGVYYHEDNIQFEKGNTKRNIALGLDNRCSLAFIVDDKTEYLKSIQVFIEDIEIQKIDFETPKLKINYQFVDWDFDGIKDLTILDNCGSGGCNYQIWNFDPITDKFVYNKQLSNRLGIELDSEKEQLIFHYREGFNHEFWIFKKYENKKLITTKTIDREVRTYDTISWNVYESYIHNGTGTAIKKDSVIIKKSIRKKRKY
jgi:hypothetical protein